MLSRTVYPTYHGLRLGISDLATIKKCVMPTLTIKPISVSLKPGCVEVLDRTGLTFVDKERQSDVTSYVVVGCGIEDRDGLFYAIRRAVKDFTAGLDADGLRKTGKISDEEKKAIIKELVEKSEQKRSIQRKWGRLLCPCCGIRTGFVKFIEEKEGEEKKNMEGKRTDDEKVADEMDLIDTLLFSSSCDPPSIALPTVLVPTVLNTAVLSPIVINPTESPASPTPTSFPNPLTPPVSPPSLAQPATHFSFPCSLPLDSSHPPTHSVSLSTEQFPNVAASTDSEPTITDSIEFVCTVSSATVDQHSESSNNAPDSTEPSPSCRIHITGFAAKMSAHRLGRHFSQAGKVVYMDLPQNRFGLPWGFAFCQFADAGSAEKAVAMFNGSVFEESWLKVKMAN
ncbi:hypothetical protein PRIPAC_75753 [Pristionchus pacificus]|uniref:RNA binding protein n=1 Tax=Pristionchus pacificus TaxID=54126 RepID=A0A2A6C6L4_PRIPA|nr:hypothetical protein PRIPAC_75753 [Pristionchus pacificus]|eukprot:PDM73757.1 RNA binding protein [Pristionchus pacificus]